MNDDEELTSAASAIKSQDRLIIGTSDLSTDTISDERLTFLQQAYQQKQAEFLAQFQRAQTNLAMQHMNYYETVQQVQNNQHNALYQNHSTLHNQSVDGSELASDSQMSSTTKECAGFRNRRSFSGSGQTISPSTKERLKTMIESKMNRNRSDSGNSRDSTPLATASKSSRASLASSLSTPAAASWSSTVESTSQMHPPYQTASIAPSTAVTSPHFEPYFIPIAVHHGPNINYGSTPTEYQLRKASSEPNLKMRIRAKLLSKGSSPIHSQSSAFTYTNPMSQPSIDIGMEMGYLPNVSSIDQQQYHPPLATAFQPPPHLIIPSPSLPNLASPVQIPMDMSALLVHALYSPFFSMPSLNKDSEPHQFSMMNSTLNAFTSDSQNGSTRQATKFDSRTLSSPLPVGGYPSLLKQQLHDLVLRRKSLVREEPEDETSVQEQLFPRLSNGLISSAAFSQLRTGLVYDSAMAKHQCICGKNISHVEHGDRVRSIWKRLQDSNLLENTDRVLARKAPLEMLKAVHSSTYVTFFAVSPTACLKVEPSQLPLKSFVQLPCGGIGVDSDTYFNDANTQLAARIAVGSLAELALQVAESRLRNGFACIRPPGHHAERDQAMGFCFFNNVAIAVKYLQQRCAEQCSQIAIVDWDVHHGNGTQLCFEADPSVLYISLHRHDNGNFFPGTGAVTEIGVGDGKGYTINIPFSGEAMDDADYLAAWRVIVIPVLKEFQPTFIMVSAGFDAIRGHSQALGGYNLSPQIFGYFTRQLMNLANGRVVLALEGGYDQVAITDAAEECVKVLTGEFLNSAGILSPEALNALPKQSAQETIQKVIAVHKRRWMSLTAVQGISTSELQWQTIAQQFASLSV